MRQVFERVSEGGFAEFRQQSPIKFTGPCDVGFMAKVDAGTAQVNVDFELLILQE